MMIYRTLGMLKKVSHKNKANMVFTLLSSTILLMLIMFVYNVIIANTHTTAKWVWLLLAEPLLVIVIIRLLFDN
ncbi:hypothetical protein [Thalassotalea piscium]|uniref:Putative integral membrane protein n=1 Tax=Thalassotalea piscium TaxID=1230533 RepID=A0A7X0NGP3_9GAMM|nr:hypothetical protein [Thalassotalea piscium]MBB6543131.1 putative integral membrane protein [Thalassotalea piscium]